jgi:hypothetical protein
MISRHGRGRNGRADSQGTHAIAGRFPEKSCFVAAVGKAQSGSNDSVFPEAVR